MDRKENSNSEYLQYYFESNKRERNTNKNLIYEKNNYINKIIMRYLICIYSFFFKLFIMKIWSLELEIMKEFIFR